MKSVTGKILGNPVLKKAFVLFWWHRLLLGVFLSACAFSAFLAVLAYCDAKFYVNPERRPEWILIGFAVLGAIISFYVLVLLFPGKFHKRFIRFVAWMRPASSKLIDPLFADEMLADDGEGVQTVLERRLADCFAGESMLERGPKHWLIGGIVTAIVCVCMLFLPFRNAPDPTSKVLLLGEWLEGSRYRKPLRITSVHPGDASLKSGEAWRLWVEFSRPVNDEGVVSASVWRPGESSSEVILKRERPCVYQALMPPIREPLNYSIRAEGVETRPFLVSVHTRQSLKLTEARGLYPGKDGVIQLDVDSRHWKLPAGTELTLTVTGTDDINAVHMMTGVEDRWKMGKTRTDNQWSRTVKLWDSRTVSFKWSTADGREGVTDIISVDVYPDTPPTLEQVAPIDGRSLSAPINVEVAATDDWGVSGVTVYLNDFMGNRRSYYYSTPKKGVLQEDFTLSEWKLRDMTGKVLALKTAVADDALPKHATTRQTTFHPYVRKSISELLEPEPVKNLFEKWLKSRTSRSDEGKEDMSLDEMRERREETRRASKGQTDEEESSNAASSEDGGKSKDGNVEEKSRGDDSGDSARDGDDSSESSQGGSKGDDGKGKGSDSTESGSADRKRGDASGDGADGDDSGGADGTKNDESGDGTGAAEADSNTSRGDEKGEQGQRSGDGRSSQEGEADNESRKEKPDGSETGNGKSDDKGRSPSSSAQGNGEELKNGEDSGKSDASRGGGECDSGGSRVGGGQSGEEQSGKGGEESGKSDASRGGGECDSGGSRGGGGQSGEEQSGKGGEESGKSDASRGGGECDSRGSRGGGKSGEEQSGKGGEESGKSDASRGGGECDSGGSRVGGKSGEEQSGKGDGKVTGEQNGSKKGETGSGESSGKRSSGTQPGGTKTGAESKRRGEKVEGGKTTSSHRRRVLGKGGGEPGGSEKIDGEKRFEGVESGEIAERKLRESATGSEPTETGKAGKLYDRRSSRPDVLKDPDEFQADEVEAVGDTGRQLRTSEVREVSTTMSVGKDGSSGVSAIPAGKLQRIIRGNENLRRRLPERERTEAEEYYRRLKDIDFIDDQTGEPPNASTRK